ncbi:hypothetical protein ACP6H4_22290 [Vibrio harveyi]|uniref:hypothetical protein n=1 Tax=Vibrio harveyi TaxID=669 RepID=UPI003CEC8696
MTNKIQYHKRRQVYKVDTDLAFSLDVFGDFLAEREGYKSLKGMDAVYFYLVHKFHWLPSVVKSMTINDLRFVLSEERHGWTMPKDAVEVCAN